MPANVRQQKLAAQLRRLVANVLLRGIADPRIDQSGALISVTKVDVTPDLREAKVYISILGGTRTPHTIFQAIQQAGRYIQDSVAENLPIRFAPRLSYHLDETLKKQAEIFKTIDDAMEDTRRNEANKPPAEEPPEPQSPPND